MLEAAQAYSGYQLDQQLSDLHRIQGSAFEQLVSRHPKAKSVIQCTVMPKAPDLAGIPA